MLECLGERTVALAQLRRLHDPAGGYDPLLERRMTGLLPLIRQNKRARRHQHGRREPDRRRGEDRGARAQARPEGARRGAHRRRRARCARPGAEGAGDRRAAVERRTAVLGQRVSRGRGDAAGARERRRCRAHRARRRPVAGARAFSASFRLDARRHGAFRARHGGRAPARMRRPDHRRLLRGSGQEGRARHGDARLSVRRRGRGRKCAALQGRGHRRRHQPHDGDRAVALRGDRSARLSDAGRHCGLFFRSRSPRPRRTRSRSPARAAAGGPIR